MLTSIHVVSGPKYIKKGIDCGFISIPKVICSISSGLGQWLSFLPSFTFKSEN